MMQRHEDSKKQAMPGLTVKTGIKAGPFLGKKKKNTKEQSQQGSGNSTWTKGEKPTGKSKTRLDYTLDNALQKISAKD
jgi:hypothetical protein